jgi:hypothetical protein
MQLGTSPSMERLLPVKGNPMSQIIRGSLEKCGCGKIVRYLVADGKTACNKQMRCPTYDELNARIGDLCGLIFMMKRKLDRVDRGCCLACGKMRKGKYDRTPLEDCSNPLCLTHEINKMCPELPVISERKSDE